MGACEPGQVRKEAALSGYFHVPWGSLTLRPYRETNLNASIMLAFFVFSAIVKFSQVLYNIKSRCYTEGRTKNGIYGII